MLLIFPFDTIEKPVEEKDKIKGVKFYYSDTDDVAVENILKLDCVVHDDHYVTITGMIDDKMQNKTILEISSFGKSII